MTLHFTVPISITPSGINTAGEQYQLACTFNGSIDSAPVFSWTGPPNGGPLPSDDSVTRMVFDVMSSGSTHTSILQFDPLQSSHEGNYTCRVIVGTAVVITSIQVNVQAPVTMTTTQQSTVTGKSASTDGTAGGTTNIIAVVAGVVVALLVVVILSVMVAVIVMVCIFRRQYSARNM